MSISLEAGAARPAGVRRLPGDLAMWFFILAELAVFGILILAFIVTQALHPELFRTGRQALDGSTGLALTLSLLTAGWCAALALARARQGLGRAPRSEEHTSELPSLMRISYAVFC